MPLPEWHEHAGPGPEALVETFCGAIEVELDHFRRAGTDQHQHADIRAALEQPGHFAVEFVMHVDHAGKIALFHDRRRKTRLGEDHHAGGRLDQMRASARSHHEEEGVLNLAMQPDDRGQTAENFMLPALADGGGRRTGNEGLVHDALPESEEPSPSTPAEPALPAWSRRARRSFQRNCPALIT